MPYITVIDGLVDDPGSTARVYEASDVDMAVAMFKRDFREAHRLSDERLAWLDSHLIGLEIHHTFIPDTKIEEC